MNGEPCIRDLRLTVRRVLEALATYPDRAELKREYPVLEDEDIRQALAFAAALVDDKTLPLPAEPMRLLLDQGRKGFAVGSRLSHFAAFGRAPSRKVSSISTI
jgi:uncharacterized protein (DUF433 family)